MTTAARSVFAFGIYVLVVGIAVAVAPDVILPLLRVPPAGDGWVRMVGVLAIVIGAYDLVSGRSNAEANIRASVPIRFAFAAACVALVVLRYMPAALLPLAS